MGVFGYEGFWERLL